MRRVQLRRGKVLVVTTSRGKTWKRWRAGSPPTLSMNLTNSHLFKFVSFPLRLPCLLVAAETTATTQWNALLRFHKTPWRGRIKVGGLPVPRGHGNLVDYIDINSSRWEPCALLCEARTFITVSTSFFSGRKSLSVLPSFPHRRATWLLVMPFECSMHTF